MPTKTSGPDLVARLERVANLAVSAAHHLAAWIEREMQRRSPREEHRAIPISRATLRGVASAPSGVGVQLTKEQIARARSIDEQAARCHPANIR